MPEFQLGFAEEAKKLGARIVGTPKTDEFPLWVPNVPGHPSFKITAQLTTKGVMLYTPENGVVFVKADVPTPGEPQEPAFIVQNIVSLLPRANLHNLQLRTLDAITMLVVHWDGGPNPGVYNGYDPIKHYVGEAQYHINKNWSAPGQPAVYGHGLMYHYKIDRKGNVYQTRNLQDIVWAAMGANNFGCMICVDGTHGAEPVDAQIDSLWRLADYLFNKRPDLPNLVSPKMSGHGMLTQFGNNTDCPGNRLRAFIKDYIS